MEGCARDDESLPKELYQNFGTPPQERQNEYPVSTALMVFRRPSMRVQLGARQSESTTFETQLRLQHNLQKP